MYPTLKLSFAVVVIALSFAYPLQLAAQATSQPLTSKELVSFLYLLPRHPEMRDDLVSEIRKRGIGFPLTDGMRSLVATKSGSDSLLRRTLEEAERRRVNPTASALPSAEEGDELLQRTRNVTLAAANAMPDFIVKQIIKRSVAYGTTSNWIPQDNLTIAVGYRANAGEEYKILTVNGLPPGDDVKESRDYSKQVPKGATSSGVEYISALADIFKPDSKTEFKLVDTDVVQNRRTAVYEYEVLSQFSQLTLRVGNDSHAIVGSRGRLWIDRELDRVVRFEQIATEIPPDFPITAASSLIDYDWVTINDHKYLLPSHSEILMTTRDSKFVVQSRNDIRFRSYQKFGAELKVVDEIGGDDDIPPEKPATPATAKPDKPIKPPL
jgi:hypothetical protein